MTIGNLRLEPGEKAAQAQEKWKERISEGMCCSFSGFAALQKRATSKRIGRHKEEDMVDLSACAAGKLEEHCEVGPDPKRGSSCLCRLKRRKDQDPLYSRAQSLIVLIAP